MKCFCGHMAEVIKSFIFNAEILDSENTWRRRTTNNAGQTQFECNGDMAGYKCDRKATVNNIFRLHFLMFTNSVNQLVGF